MKNHDQWHRFTYELKFYLGEYTVTKFNLQVQRKVFSLNDIINHNCDLELPPDLDLDLDDGFLIADFPRECSLRTSNIRNGLIYYCVKSYSRCYIDMTIDFDDYKSKFSAKTKSGINRKINKLSREVGDVGIQQYSTPDQICEFFQMARPISAVSYQERLLDCGLPTGQNFVKSSIKAATQDKLRAYILFINNTPVSYLYCPVENKVIQYAYLGYIPEYAKFSPGTILQWLATEKLFSEKKFIAFDFTEGDSEHKKFFSTHQVPCSIELVLKLGLKSRLIIVIHQFFCLVSDMLVQALRRLGLKSIIKKWLRKKA